MKPKRTPTASDREQVKIAARMSREEAAAVARKRVAGQKRRRKNAASQEEVNKFVADFDSETLYARGAYGRRPTVKDWQAGKDFEALNPERWKGGPYFSVRNAEQIYELGYRRIVFGGAEGFTVDLVMQ